ncbi:MAG: V-type ATPase 116kDa subunit family protein [Candidatus Poseidoniaceae archaeon]|jgi:V/A-type H+-transporting ATPase subunit I|nr:V-type ATPase 116kDa subunit family protein [Candidatus Poseidoniaceae archaeon]
MFSVVEMSRLVMAGNAVDLDSALRVCADLGNVHITPYSGDEEGITVGKPHSDADKVSAMLAKVRAVNQELKCINRDGPILSSEVEKQVNSKSSKGNFSDRLDSILEVITSESDARADLARMAERVSILETISPLNIPLELMTGIESLEVYIGETPKAAKAKQVFGDLLERVEMHVAGNVIAVACQGKEAAEVQMALGELGSKPIQIPSGKGTPSSLLIDAKKEIDTLEQKIKTSEEEKQTWAEENGRTSVAVQEYLQRENQILTGHTLCATSSHAYAMEAWVPTASADKIRSKLSKVSSHLTIKEFEEDHHHDDDHHQEYPPVEYNTLKSTRHASLLTNLVGRPKYGTIDPTTMMAYTFPLFYGLILGDMGYGLILMLIALALKSNFGHNPSGAFASRIMMNMGIATFTFGFITAEAFGFIIDGTEHYFDWAPLTHMYHDLHESIHLPHFFSHTLKMSDTHVPFHRVGVGMMDYVLLSIYLGATHIVVGFLIGFINVFRAHGIAAAFFEKGSWLFIMFGGFGHIFRFITDERYELFSLTGWSLAILFGLGCLIIGLAIFEKFGWVGGFIMGPIELFGLLANTLSYLRIMAVGVAGVKIAELGNDMGFFNMVNAFNDGNYLVLIACFVLWISVQVFALLLGILSPSIHAVRLHFVEWMSKFHDGSGQEFSPFGGRDLNVENT